VYGRVLDRDVAALHRLILSVWNLAPPIAVLPDEGGTIARRFAVTETPTTFLIDQHGIINKRWHGFVLVAKLDAAIRALEGRRPGRTSAADG